MLPADSAAQIRGMLPSAPGDGVHTALEWTGCGAGNEPASDVSWYAGFQTGADDPIVVVAVLEGARADAGAVGRQILAKALALS
jgi:hypothetical protein